MADFKMTELVNDWQTRTARLGAGTYTANNNNIFTGDTEVGKFVKLAGASRFNLSVVGDEIEAWVSSVERAKYNDFSIGGISRGGNKEVTFDGLQATPGTGTLAIGDYVLVGTPVAKGTALSGPARVVKATDQVGAKTSPFAYRVVDLGTAGTGAVGTTGLIAAARS